MALTWNGAFNGLSTLGKYRAYGTAFCMGLVAICLLVSAIRMFFAKDTTVRVTAKVTAADCKTIQQWVSATRRRPGYFKTAFDCDMTIEYTVNGAKQTVKVRNVYDNPYSVGASITGRADTANPTSFTANLVAKRTTSYVLSGFACLLTLLVVCQIVVARNRIASAAYGAKTVFNMFDPRTYTSGFNYNY